MIKPLLLGVLAIIPLILSLLIVNKAEAINMNNSNQSSAQHSLYSSAK